MDRASRYRCLRTIALAACLGSYATVPAAGQVGCRGDVDGDGVVTAGDLSAAASVIFGESADVGTTGRADVNGDGRIGAADLVAVVPLNGFVCPGVTVIPSATPTPTTTFLTPPASPTPTPTRGAPTGTPTQTLTFGPSPTPTATCVVVAATLGTNSGELTASDCPRTFVGEPRYADAYSFTGTPGQRITVNVSSGVTGFVPLVALVDGDGQFFEFNGAPPVQFVITTARPYLVYVSTSPTSTTQLGTYQMSLSATPCATPKPVTLPTTQNGNLDGTECPDPALPLAKGQTGGADTYTFTVSQVPTNLQITMRRVGTDSTLEPLFSVIGPDGWELFPPDDDNLTLPSDPDGIDKWIRFLALQAGTYTVIAQSDADLGRYSLSLVSPACTPKALGTIPSVTSLTVSGQLVGNTTLSTCAAPLPIPVISDDAPELNSPADLYSFTAGAGDVISVTMHTKSSLGDAHLYLLGPASAGNPLVVQDDDSLPGGDAQLAVTVPQAGTYTIIAANNFLLDPPDPTDPTDRTGDVVNYTLSVQKCPVAGGLDVSNGTSTQANFSNLDCLGFGNKPYRSYAFAGTAGQFVTVSMTSSVADSSLRLIAPDGSALADDADPFQPGTNDARVSRILPTSGSYYVEVSTAAAVDLTQNPAFTVRAQTCPTTPAAAGTVSGAFQDGDCELTPGRKYDVYTVAGTAATPKVLSLRAPTRGCVQGLMVEGLQIPPQACDDQLLDLPLSANGTYGFIVAADDATTRGTYAAALALCPESVIGFGDSRSGALTGGNCQGGDGIGADWFLLRASASVTRFNDGFFGTVSTSAGLLANVSDLAGVTPVTNLLVRNAENLFPLGTDLAALLKITGMSATDRGSYRLEIESASLRQ